VGEELGLLEGSVVGTVVGLLVDGVPVGSLTVGRIVGQLVEGASVGGDVGEVVGLNVGTFDGALDGSVDIGHAEGITVGDTVGSEVSTQILAFMLLCQRPSSLYFCNNRQELSWRSNVKAIQPTLVPLTPLFAYKHICSQSFTPSWCVISPNVIPSRLWLSLHSRSQIEGSPAPTIAIIPSKYAHPFSSHIRGSLEYARQSTVGEALGTFVDGIKLGHE